MTPEALLLIHDQTGLSAREAQVLDARVRGESFKSIGFLLGIKWNTVTTHQKRALLKLHVRTLRGAARKWRAFRVQNIEWVGTDSVIPKPQ